MRAGAAEGTGRKACALEAIRASAHAAKIDLLIACCLRCKGNNSPATHLQSQPEHKSTHKQNRQLACKHRFWATQPWNCHTLPPARSCNVRRPRFAGGRTQRCPLLAHGGIFMWHPIRKTGIRSYKIRQQSGCCVQTLAYRTPGSARMASASTAGQQYKNQCDWLGPGRGRAHTPRSWCF